MPSRTRIVAALAIVATTPLAAQRGAFRAASHFQLLHTAWMERLAFLSERLFMAPLGADKQYVRSRFNAIARRYDFLNHLLSGGIDVSWRRKAIGSAALPVSCWLTAFAPDSRAPKAGWILPGGLRKSGACKPSTPGSKRSIAPRPPPFSQDHATPAPVPR